MWLSYLLQLQMLSKWIFIYCSWRYPSSWNICNNEICIPASLKYIDSFFSWFIYNTWIWLQSRFEETKKINWLPIEVEMHPIVTSTHSFRRIENEDFIGMNRAMLNSFLPCQYTVSESRAFNWFILWFRQRNKCTVYRITEKHKYLLRSLFQPCRSHFLGRDKRCYKWYEDIGPYWSRAQSPLTGKEKFPFLTQFGISKSQGSWNSTKTRKEWLDFSVKSSEVQLYLKRLKIEIGIQFDH